MMLLQPHPSGAEAGGAIRGASTRQTSAACSVAFSNLMRVSLKGAA